MIEQTLERIAARAREMVPPENYHLNWMEWTEGKELVRHIHTLYFGNGFTSSELLQLSAFIAVLADYKIEKGE